MREEDFIDNSAAAIEGKEELIRLLCSPLYYDEETQQVNVDAFDLRIFRKKGVLVPESYVSLGRMRMMADEKALNDYLQLGYIIWKDKHKVNDYYSAYGIFVCQCALQISNMIKIHPLKNSKLNHIGLFYVKSDNEYYKGPLPKNDVGVLEALTGLASLLEERICKAPARNAV